MKTALVLSGGGMFGAWQAGAWKAIADSFEPDLVVGASIGAVNGWAIAGGCPPDELIDAWLNLKAAGRFRWQMPRGPFRGVLNSEPLLEAIRGIHSAYRPRTEFALVVTDLLKLRPMQFCIFLKALVGAEEMKKMMLKAIVFAGRES